MTVLALCLTPLAILWEAFVFRQAWLWFVVPLGAPELCMAHSAGLLMLIAIGFYPPLLRLRDTRKGDELALAFVTHHVTYPTVVLFFAWVAHVAMP